MQRETITFSSGDFRLVGTLDLPEKVVFAAGADELASPRVPGVLFCHGFTGHRIEARRLFARMGEKLANSGIACLRFDHRGCGESDGDFLDFTAAGLLEDLDAAIGQFVDSRWLDQTRAAVLGYSLGGVSASYVASKLPDMRTAVFWAPVSRADLLRRRLEDPNAKIQYQRDGYLDWGGFRVSKGLFENLQLLKPLEWAASFKNPALFCHASGDEVVPPQNSDAYLQARANHGDEQVILPGGDHGFGNASLGDKLIEVTARWAEKQLA